MGIQTTTPSVPVVTGVEPRGRRGKAAVGVVLLLGGIAALVLAAQGILPLPMTSVPALPNLPGSSSTSPGIAPSGAQPASFTAYYDAQHRFALYISSTWAGKASTITVKGQAQPTTTFAPTSSALPNWRIAFLSSAIPATGLGYTNALADILAAEGGTNVTPVQGPLTVTAGLYQWSRLDVNAQLKGGVTARVVAFQQTLANGTIVLIIEEAQSIMFSTSEKQNFTPMLNSLFLHG